MKKMNKVYKLSMAAIAASLVLVNCSSVEELIGDDGDNSVSETFTGQFVDTYVKGLNYTCIGWVDGESEQVINTGVTNAKGEFTCNDRGDVEFSIGKYVLGRAYADSIMYPSHLVSANGASLDIAQLLQTIDDHSVDGALTIPDNFTALDSITVKPGNPDFDALLADALPNAAVLVSEEVAQAHLDESRGAVNPAPAPLPPVEVSLEGFVSGKVLSFTNQTEPENDIVATFNADYSYNESGDEHTCSGKWAVVSENGTDYIGVTCDSPSASTVTPTSPSNSDLVYEFLGERTNGMSVKLHTSDENDADVIFEGTITIRDI